MTRKGGAIVRKKLGILTCNGGTRRAKAKRVLMSAKGLRLNWKGRAL